MRKLPPGFAAAFFLLAPAGHALTGETRSIHPTQEEIERFELPAPSADIALPEEGSRSFAAAGLGIFAASAADFATTEWGLSRGLQEGNPVASQRGIRLVHHVAGPALVYWSTERLRKSGKPRLALGLRIALMAAYSYAAIHNVRQVGGVPVAR
jgi:hypothetical protein